MIWKIIICIALVELLGLSSVLFTSSDIGTVYKNLQTLYPDVAYPPQWLFSPVWIILYALLGFVLAVNLPPNVDRPIVVILFMVGLALNISWSPLYFDGQRQNALYTIIAITVVNIALIGYLISITIKSKRVVDILSIIFLSLYGSWIGFATYLNASTVDELRS